jgi:ribosome-associated protein
MQGNFSCSAYVSSLNNPPQKKPKKPSVPLDVVLSSLAAMKSENQVVIPLNGKSSLVDYMVIVNGTSDRHVKGIADNLTNDLRDNAYGSYIPELGQDNAWVLLDLGEIIVHIFKQETRELYALEKMWSVSDLKKNYETISF